MQSWLYPRSIIARAESFPAVTYLTMLSNNFFWTTLNHICSPNKLRRCPHPNVIHWLFLTCVPNRCLHPSTIHWNGLFPPWLMTCFSSHSLDEEPLPYTLQPSQRHLYWIPEESSLLSVSSFWFSATAWILWNRQKKLSWARYCLCLHHLKKGPISASVWLHFKNVIFDLSQ